MTDTDILKSEVFKKAVKNAPPKRLGWFLPSTEPGRSAEAVYAEIRVRLATYYWLFDWLRIHADSGGHWRIIMEKLISHIMYGEEPALAIAKTVNSLCGESDA